MSFSKILIANRGEIALRVIRACRELGIKSIAVYSDIEKDALHTRYADEAICIGPASLRESYLNIPNIISAALIKKADAIYPGYGMLSENHFFAQMCEKLGIVFIGPRAEIIEKMGNKFRARKIMEETGLPVLPSSDTEISDLMSAHFQAEKIGYPLMIKASSGGGGKGLRLVENSKELEKSLPLACKEAASYFGNDRVYLEKYLPEARHIEFQVLGDKKGNVIHLFDRDCSIQLRHQKILEEAPSPAVSPQLRVAIGNQVVQSAKNIGYENAGTFEFLMDKNGKYYFIEINTRIQVEHPITEMITGINLIKEQIRLAAGEPLTLTQDKIIPFGHSIECRIYAELVNDQTLSSQFIKTLIPPGGYGVRFDTAAQSNYPLPIQYDALIGKLIVHGHNRSEAIARMRRALMETIIQGISTNIPLHLKILASERFKNGDYNSELIRSFHRNLKAISQYKQ